MQNDFPFFTMNPIHIISGPPASFAKKFNKLVASEEVALSIVSLTSGGGRVVAVVEATRGSKQTRGAPIEVRALTRQPEAALAKLAEENPCWSVLAAFDFPAAPAAKQPAAAKPEPEAAGDEAAAEKDSGLLVIAVLRQP